MHHAGLTQEERDLIEKGYRDGLIKILCCTSTLAAGVNLPTKRVIIRDIHIGNQILDSVRYLQMAGRAGRTGFDSYGESYLFLPSTYKDSFFNILKSNTKPIQSTLSIKSHGVQKLLLDIISTKICKTEEDIYEMIHSTLYYSQHNNNNENIDEIIKNEIQYLKDCKFITIQSDNILIPTPLGSAIYYSSFSVSDAITVYNDLKRAIESFDISNETQILYCLTPVYIYILLLNRLTLVFHLFGHTIGWNIRSSITI